VSKQLHKEIDTTSEAIIDGDVEIEFSIDDLGKARDIKITKSLNEQSDAEAMDIVKKWPAWITTQKHKKGKVVIQF
jgi:TonB family protein